MLNFENINTLFDIRINIRLIDHNVITFRVFFYKKQKRLKLLKRKTSTIR